MAASLHVGATVVLGVISALPRVHDVWILFFIVIGIAQLIYIGPAIVIMKSRGLHRAVKGLIIGATITFLLNAACWGLVGGAFLL